MSGDVTPLSRRRKVAELGDPRDIRRSDEDVPSALQDPRDLRTRGRREREAGDGSDAFPIIDAGDGSDAFPIIDAGDPGSGTS